MKKLFILISAVLSSISYAESAKLTIEGMHCGGCKKMVTKKVCDDTALSQNFETCEVEVNTKKQIGTLKLIFKKDSKPDMVAIEKAIHAAGEDYKITNTEITK